MNEYSLKLLSMCIEAKKNGHDCFFEYAAHVEKIDIRIFINGWVTGANEDFSFEYYPNNEKNKKFGSDIEDIEYVLNILIGGVKYASTR